MNELHILSKQTQIQIRGVLFIYIFVNLFCQIGSQGVCQIGCQIGHVNLRFLLLTKQAVRYEACRKYEDQIHQQIQRTYIYSGASFMVLVRVVWLDNRLLI